MTGLAKRNQGVLLFALCVVLLLIVSARSAPGEAIGVVLPKTAEDMLIQPPRSLTGAPFPAEREETAAQSSAVLKLEEEGAFDIRKELSAVSAGDWNLRLVNEEYLLPASYAPNLREIRDGESVDSRAADALTAMLEAAEAEGYTVYLRAGYRSYQTQTYLFYNRASQLAENQGLDYTEAERIARGLVAFPGSSEHQTGLAVDIMDNARTPMIEDEAEKLPVIAWLRRHCAEYGFVPRYPRDKENLTGWYEPWHFRYVGQAAAAYMMENGLCLEELIALF